MKMEPHNRFDINFHNRTDFDFKNVELNTCIIIDEALKRGIKPEFVLGKYLLLALDGERSLFHISDNSSLSYLAQRISASKFETKEFLNKAGIITPRGQRFNSLNLSDIVAFAHELGNPCVIKPEFGSEGKSVYCNVKPENIEQIVKSIGKKPISLVVEEQISGNEYRVFTTAKGYVCASMRRPASVVGDGEHNIKFLIDEKNQDRQLKHTFPLITPFYQIPIDDVVSMYLKEHSMGLDYTPDKGERVFLRGNSNISTGGDSITMQECDIHPKIREIALTALSAIPGMSYAGIDIITNDISQAPNRYAILELNNMPGISLLHYPYIGQPHNAAGALLDLVFTKSKS